MAISFKELREQMVEQQLSRRGIRDPRVLRAMREVPREEFIAPELVEFAYEDTPLPIEEDQTISQPFIVAYMLQALELSGDGRALEVGTGSGYAAAVLSRMVKNVYTIERHGSLARAARSRFQRLGLRNIHILHADGSKGWAGHAPYHAILASAAGKDIPKSLLEQLADGGRLVIPVGTAARGQKLIRVTRRGGSFKEEYLTDVRFVPLIEDPPPAPPPKKIPEKLPEIIKQSCEPFSSIRDIPLDNVLRRVGDARVVLLGEATHGTEEFYDARARLTRELIIKKGFRIVALEADWPDAAQVNHYVRGTSPLRLTSKENFSRFPVWMWRNVQFLEFIGWVKEYNEQAPEHQKAGLYGMDLYNLVSSINSILSYLEEIDPEAAVVARKRYGCLTPWEQDPAVYGQAVISGRYQKCEKQIVSTLRDLLKKRLEYSQKDSHSFFDAAQNARLIKNAERYYRVMYYGSRESWNLRDTHMFETLLHLLDHFGENSKAVVWAHNSHTGDASMTEMSSRGEHNIGQLCRQHFRDKVYSIGFGTDHGSVMASRNWGEEGKMMAIRPAHEDSYEFLCHESGTPSFLLPLRYPRRPEIRIRLMRPRLERAVGVIYRPESELLSHYFQAVLPRQFDEYIWFDETAAVTPLGPQAAAGMPETFPFGY